MAEIVTAPDGRTWTVRRRWVPRLRGESLRARFHRRWRQTRRRAGDAADADPGCLDVIGEGIVAAVIAIVVAVVVLFVLIPLLVALVELVVLLALAVLATLARVLLRRPWIIEAYASDTTTLTWRVAGWRASGEKCAEVAQLLQAGITPPAGAR